MLIRILTYYIIIQNLNLNDLNEELKCQDKIREKKENKKIIIEEKKINLNDLNEELKVSNKIREKKENKPTITEDKNLKYSLVKYALEYAQNYDKNITDHFF